MTEAADIGAEKPSRPTRAEAVRTERRRKPGSLAAGGMKLAVDESKLDRVNYHYRQVNDTPGRLQQLEGQDYDIAPEVGASVNSNGVGTVNSVLAGVKDGKPYNTVLMRKPIAMHEEDQKLKQKPLDEMEDAIRRGRGASTDGKLQGDGVYTPGTGVNIIERA